VEVLVTPDLNLHNPAADTIRAARELARPDRRRAIQILNGVFRAGQPPDRPLDGSTDGALLTLDVAPGLTQAFAALADAWMPWRGKIFDARGASGINRFSTDSLFLAHVLWPLFRGYALGEVDTYHAFSFKTYLAPGLSDPDRQVLKLDYDLSANPSVTIRRVLDELVQVGEGLYLGKAHLHWWWGRWQCVAYFQLIAQ
jgi:hypothetical protein